MKGSSLKASIILISVILAPVAGLWALQTGLLVSTKQLLQILLFVWPATIAAGWIVLSILTRIAPASRPNAQSWSVLSKMFHWGMALTILGTTALMYYMVNIGDLTLEVYRAEYSRLLKTHKSLGLVILFLVALRFAWNRWRPRPPLPADMSSKQKLASRAGHHVLYLLMLVVPLLGWMASMTYGGRTFFFGWFEMPVWLPKNLDWANVLQPAHIWMAWGLLAIVGVHTLAALWHHFVRRDATLVQMLPKIGDRDR